MKRAYHGWIFVMLITGLYSLGAKAQNAKLGFYLPTSSAIPKAVQQASRSVFLIKAPLIRYEPRNETLDSLLEKIIPGYKDIKDELNPNALDLIKSQIDACEKKPNELCTLYDEATAFLAQDQTSIWTALHNLHTFISELAKKHHLDLTNGISEEELTTIRKFEIPVRLYNKAGSMIFGHSGDYATVDFLDPIFKKGMAFGVDIKFMDYIRLRLSRPLDRPALKFNIRKSHKNAGEVVYIVGYPRATQDRVNFGKPDSDGKSLRVSSGPILSYKSANKRTENILDEALKLLEEETSIYIAGDCVAGNSGGPLLDKRGQVIGLFNSTTPGNVGLADLKATCYSIRSRYLLEFTRIEFE